MFVGRGNVYIVSSYQVQSKDEGSRDLYAELGASTRILGKFRPMPSTVVLNRPAHPRDQAVFDPSSESCRGCSIVHGPPHRQASKYPKPADCSPDAAVSSSIAGVLNLRYVVLAIVVLFTLRQCARLQERPNHVEFTLVVTPTPSTTNKT
ncbi:hypothetical protein AaE_007340 [Aphanomyces astaci]|uniref:Uncharacterized protein n=1 Tax=Aphanomyces astaci TaxID=112090 RepID=A0A6A5AAJ6_APHAT|nr:hypothetical protein AaE_007340 [Aphanomyces astaci]